MYSADRLRCAGHGTLLSGGGGYRGATNHGNTAADGDASTYCHARTGRYAGNTGGTDPDRDGSPGRGRRHRALYADLDAAGKGRPALFIRPDALDPAQTPGQINSSETEGVKTLTDDMRAVLAAYPVGGVAIFGKNISDPETLRAFTEQLRDATTVPLFLGVDEEGGACCAACQ